MQSSNTIKSMIFAAAALTAVGVTSAYSDDDDGWFWNRGRMGEWFRGEMMDHHMRWGGGHGMMMGGRFGEERLNALKSELAITTAQEKAWGDYAQAVKVAADSMRESHKNMMSSDFPKTLPERIAFHETMMSARMAEMKAMNEATLALYNTLDATQKAKADEVILGMGMM